MVSLMRRSKWIYDLLIGVPALCPAVVVPPPLVLAGWGEHLRVKGYGKQDHLSVTGTEQLQMKENCTVVLAQVSEVP